MQDLDGFGLDYTEDPSEFRASAPEPSDLPVAPDAAASPVASAVPVAPAANPPAPAPAAAATPPPSVPVPAPQAGAKEDQEPSAVKVDAAPGPDEEAPEEEEEDGLYRRRRKLAVLGICFLAVLALFLVIRLGSQPSTGQVSESPRANSVAAPPTVEESADAEAQLRSLVVKAKAHRAVEGTFVGFDDDLARVAASSDALVVSLVVGGSCFYSGVVPGQEEKVLPDPTGAACTDELVREAQAQFDAEAAAKQADALAAGTDDLAAAVESVQYYASRSYVDGEPSFVGLTESGVPGVEIVELSERSAVLQYRLDDGGCLLVRVDPAGSSAPFGGSCS